MVLCHFVDGLSCNFMRKRENSFVVLKRFDKRSMAICFLCFAHIIII